MLRSCDKDLALAYNPHYSVTGQASNTLQDTLVASALYVCMYIYVRKYMNTFMYMCACVHIYMLMHIYIYIYTKCVCVCLCVRK